MVARERDARPQQLLRDGAGVGFIQRLGQFGRVLARAKNLRQGGGLPLFVRPGQIELVALGASGLLLEQSVIDPAQALDLLGRRYGVNGKEAVLAVEGDLLLGECDGRLDWRG